MCNECGNCAVFCPDENGRPDKDKLTLFWSGDDMLDSENDASLRRLEDGSLRPASSGETHVVDVDDASCGVPETVRRTIVAVRDDYSYLLAR